MAKEKKGEGFHSAAGLIRYFDAEEKTAFKIDPKVVVIMSFLLAVGVTVAKVMWPVSG
ncbi:MAG TPA: preprotein translocase subunit Sec61beta [Candidatus Thermoplasmatota archaeon]|nr:preprotein translocase subunit Sec61beta [Candidatus Thermoplasmatota archaeon]